MPANKVKQKEDFQVTEQPTDSLDDITPDEVLDAQEPTPQDLAELNDSFQEPEEDYGGILGNQTSLSSEQDINDEVINDNTMDEVEDPKTVLVTEDEKSGQVFVTDLEEVEDEIDEENKASELIDDLEDEKFDEETSGE